MSTGLQRNELLFNLQLLEVIQMERTVDKVRQILCNLKVRVLAAGVASGATRAALTQHFALRKNAADVSAKVPIP